MTRLQRTRLVKLLGLLGSDFEGERATAAAMANRLVREAGCTWESVVALPDAVPVAPRPRKPRSPRPPPAPSAPPAPVDLASATALAADLLKTPAPLRPNDLEFLRSLVTWRKCLTAKQAKWLGDIAERVRRAREAGEA